MSDGTPGTPVATRARDGARPSARDLRHVPVFTGLAFVLAWLVALPLWSGDGLASPWFPSWPSP